MTVQVFPEHFLTLVQQIPNLDWTEHTAYLYQLIDHEVVCPDWISDKRNLSFTTLCWDVQ